MPNRKGSAKDQAAEVDSASPSDIASLLRETEDRLMKFFKDEICKVTDRLDRMEKNISSLQCECIRLDNEMTKTREVLIRQQVTIENHEASIRAANLIFHNIPENVVTLEDDQSLDTDTNKVEHILQKSNLHLDSSDIKRVQRLGKRSDKPRLLKVILQDKDDKFRILNKRSEISKNRSITDVFGSRVFVNQDSSFLVQKEEKRLRSKLESLKQEYSNDNIFIRSGVLYHNGKTVDRVDVSKQLF